MRGSCRGLGPSEPWAVEGEGVMNYRPGDWGNGTASLGKKLGEFGSD